MSAHAVVNRPPVKLVPQRFSDTRRGIKVVALGTMPKRQFECKSRYPNELMFPHAAGKVPLKLLEYRNIY